MYLDADLATKQRALARVAPIVNGGREARNPDEQSTD
jgi:hypothetical protein